MWLSFPSQLSETEMIWCLTPKWLSSVEMPTNSSWLAKNEYRIAVPGKFSPLGNEAVSEASQGPVRHSAVNRMRLPADVWRVESPSLLCLFLCWFYRLCLVTHHTFPHVSQCSLIMIALLCSSVLTHMLLPSGLDISIWMYIFVTFTLALPPV